MSTTDVIQLGSDFPKGLDFQSWPEFLDASLIGELLRELRRKIANPTAIAYCLQLEVGNGTSQFVPYAKTGLPTTEVSLPNAIDTKRIAGQGEEWNPVTYSTGFSPGAALTDPRLFNSRWHGQIRVMVGREYVGYCKLVMPAGEQSPSRDEFLDCFYQAVVFLKEKIANRQSKRLLLSRELSATTAEVDAAIANNDPIAALRHLLTLITSHFGANINRIACFSERSKGHLECLYGHGGDGTRAWADQVQTPIGRLNVLAELHALAQRPSHEVDDLYRRTLLTPSPLCIDLNEPDCLLAEIWKKKCDLNWLPAANALEFEEANFAARFSDEDAWPQRVAAQDQSGTIFASQNHQHFILPWQGHTGPIGIILCDFASWADINIWHEAVPRLLRARTLLAHYAPTFEGVARRGWR